MKLETLSPEQRRVMRDLVRLSTRLVVMSERGREFLREVYDVPESKVDLIFHGIPDVPFADPNYFKDEFAVAGKQVLLTFGLLSPNKGIEYALRALPDIIREFPNVVYIVLGQTHPNLLRDEGEAYRLSLERLAKDPHYFANPDRALFQDIRRYFPITAQAQVAWAVNKGVSAAVGLLVVVVSVLVVVPVAVGSCAGAATGVVWIGVTVPVLVSSGWPPWATGLPPP